MAPSHLIRLLSLSLLGISLAHGKPRLPRSTPEVEGISSAAIERFVKTANDKVDSMHSFVMLRHGKVVAEAWWAPFQQDTPHKLFSLSKSFTSTAVGMAIAEGKLQLEDTVLSFFPEEAPAAPSANLKNMRLRDLLCMSTGHVSGDLDTFSFQSDELLTKAFLALPVAHKPGTHFLYNTPATYMCSAIVQKVTGMPVVDYLKPRLFEPLGIDAPRWDASPQGISLGGYGLNVLTEDIAAFGQLYLQNGNWQGKQLIPESWVAATTSKQTSNGSNPASDWDQGYGFQFWRCRNHCYRGDGAFGQYCLVMPDQDAVIAITSGTGDMQGILNLVWEVLLPEMKPHALPYADVAEERLTKTLAGLSLPTVRGEPTSPMAGRVSGKTYMVATNDLGLKSITWTAKESGAVLALGIGDETFALSCGQDAWASDRTALPKALPQRVADPMEQAVALSGSWTADTVYTAKAWFTESPLALTFSLRFNDDAVSLGIESNVNFGPRSLGSFPGKLTSE